MTQILRRNLPFEDKREILKTFLEGDPALQVVQLRNNRIVVPAFIQRTRVDLYFLAAQLLYESFNDWQLHEFITSRIPLFR